MYSGAAACLSSGCTMPLTGMLLKSDRASGLLAGRFQGYAPCPRDGSAFAWPEDDTPWGVCLLFLRIRFAHGLVSPLEVGTIYIILVFLYDPLPWWANSYSEAYCYPARRIRRRSIHRDTERNCPRRRVAVTRGRRVQAPEARALGGGWRRRWARQSRCGAGPLPALGESARLRGEQADPLAWAAVRNR